MLISPEAQDVRDGGKGVLLGVLVALQYVLHWERQRGGKEENKGLKG